MKILLQGLTLPAPKATADVPVPPPLQRPSSPPPPPAQPHLFKEAEDTRGQAQMGRPCCSASLSRTTVWRQQKKAAAGRSTVGGASTSAIPTPATGVTSTSSASLSRTTEWRQQKKAAAGRSTVGGASTSAIPTPATGATSTSLVVQRKVYSCRKCGKPSSSPDHSQFRGQQYCPSAYPDLTKEEWLAQRRAEAAKQQKQQKQQ